MVRRRAKQRSTNVTDLPDQVLLLVFRQAGLARLAAAQACKHWRDLSHDAAFCHTVLRGGCIATALSIAAPGDTVELACGMYEVSLAQCAGKVRSAALLDGPRLPPEAGMVDMCLASSLPWLTAQGLSPEAGTLSLAGSLHLHILHAKRPGRAFVLHCTACAGIII